MKKIAFMLAFLALLTTGCTKTYKSVEKYNEDMNTVKSSNDCYTINAELTSDLVNGYYKLYTKGDKWKLEESLKKDNPISTIIFTGNEMLIYNSNSNIAISDSDNKSYRNDAEKKETARLMNPLFYLTDWNDNVLLGLSENEPAQFVNNNETINGYKCRMISYGDKKEVCVSDKYGIAVYSKIKYEKSNKEEEIIINVTNISNEEIPDSEFLLPEGIKKTTLNKMFADLKNNSRSF